MVEEGLGVGTALGDCFGGDVFLGRFIRGEERRECVIRYKRDDSCRLSLDSREGSSVGVEGAQ